jgi:hypothetical protein
VTPSEIHARLATSLFLFMLLACVWSLVTALRRQGVGPNLWGIYAVGEILALAQFALGLWLLLGGLRPDRWVHLLYGVSAVLALPAYYAISRGRDDRTASFVYAGLCLFLAFIAYRAMITG